MKTKQKKTSGSTDFDADHQPYSIKYCWRNIDPGQGEEEKEEEIGGGHRKTHIFFIFFYYSMCNKQTESS